MKEKSTYLFRYLFYLGSFTGTYYALKPLTCVICEYKTFPPRSMRSQLALFLAYLPHLQYHDGAMSTAMVAHVWVHRRVGTQICVHTHTPSLIKMAEDISHLQ